MALYEAWRNLFSISQWDEFVSKTYLRVVASVRRCVQVQVKVKVCEKVSVSVGVGVGVCVGVNVLM